jgi:hypothetical protein
MPRTRRQASRQAGSRLPPRARYHHVRTHPLRQTVETGNDRFVFLDYLRALAAWAVVWNHMLATWPEQRGIHLLVVTPVRAWITQPPGVIQDFG